MPPDSERTEKSVEREEDEKKKENDHKAEQPADNTSGVSKGSESGIKKKADEEKIDKSLDEVSNVIHDLLNEPSYEDTDEKIESVISKTETGAEAAGKKPEPGGRLGRLSGLFKKGSPTHEKAKPAKKTPEPEEGPALEPQKNIPDSVVESLLEPREVKDQYSSDKKYTFDEFVDERILISRDAFGRKEMKIKVLEVSDEKSPTAWKLGDRVKVNKILVTMKHLESQEVEEGEFDIEAIEEELVKERHYSSTNRWVPTSDIKNGYVASSRHTTLISDAMALDYIIF